MDKQEILTKVAAILSTLAEMNSGTPESMLYIFCDMDMGKWNQLRYILVEAGFVTIKGHYVTLTEDGRLKAETINRLIAAKGN